MCGIIGAVGRGDATLDVLLDHLEHAVSVLGPDRVGIGTDFFPADTRFPSALLEYYTQHIVDLGFDREMVEQRTTIAGGLGAFETYENWPAIREAVERRFSPREAEGILGENFLRYWSRSTDGHE